MVVDHAGLPPCRRAAGAAGPARHVGADRRARPAARPDRLGLLRRGRLDGAAGASRRGREAGRPGRRVGATVTTATAARLASPIPRLADLASALRRESGLFVLGIVVIALHVLDDNFVQPPAGHVGRRSPRQRPRPARRARARGLGVSAPARRPARERWRCCSALFGIVAGIEAVHYTAKVGRIRRRLHRPARHPRRAAAARPRRRDAVEDAADRRQPPVALPAPRAARRRGRRRRIVRRRAPERGIPLHAPGTPGRARGEPRRRLRAGLVHHERRPRSSPAGTSRRRTVPP